MYYFLGTDPAPPAYEMMSVVFKGSPSEEKIKPVMERVMLKYNLNITEENLKKVANVLNFLSDDSKTKVTEMDILNDMDKNGLEKTTFPEQAALSAIILEI